MSWIQLSDCCSFAVFLKISQLCFLWKEATNYVWDFSTNISWSVDNSFNCYILTRFDSIHIIKQNEFLQISGITKGRQLYIKSW
jgi:hypothetical protein